MKTQIAHLVFIRNGRLTVVDSGPHRELCVKMAALKTPNHVAVMTDEAINKALSSNWLSPLNAIH